MATKIRFWLFGGASAQGRATARANQEQGTVHLAADVPNDLGINVPANVPLTGDVVTHVVFSDAEFTILADE